MSATAATPPVENKEGLIISDGNSRINNRGLARRSRREKRERGLVEQQGCKDIEKAGSEEGGSGGRKQRRRGKGVQSAREESGEEGGGKVGT